MSSHQHLLSVITLLLVIVGMAGLIYRIVWFKYLSFSFGHTTAVQTMARAPFIGELALGIGVCGLLYPFILDVVRSLFVAIVIQSYLPPDSRSVLILNLVISVVTYLVLTVVRGGFLPLLVREISYRIEKSGKNIPASYSRINFRTGVGSLLGEFFSIVEAARNTPKTMWLLAASPRSKSRRGKHT